MFKSIGFSEKNKIINNINAIKTYNNINSVIDIKNLNHRNIENKIAEQLCKLAPIRGLHFLGCYDIFNDIDKDCFDSSVEKILKGNISINNLSIIEQAMNLANYYSINIDDYLEDVFKTKFDSLHNIILKELSKLLNNNYTLKNCCHLYEEYYANEGDFNKNIYMFQDIIAKFFGIDKVRKISYVSTKDEYDDDITELYTINSLVKLSEDELKLINTRVLDYEGSYHTEEEKSYFYAYTNKNNKTTFQFSSGIFLTYTSLYSLFEFIKYKSL